MGKNRKNKQSRRELKILTAAKYGDLTQVKYFITKKVNVNCVNDRKTPLHLACENGHVKIVKFLLMHGGKVLFLMNMVLFYILPVLLCKLVSFDCFYIMVTFQQR